MFSPKKINPVFLGIVVLLLLSFISRFLPYSPYSYQIFPWVVMLFCAALLARYINKLLSPTQPDILPISWLEKISILFLSIGVGLYLWVALFNSPIPTSQQVYIYYVGSPFYRYIGFIDAYFTAGVFYSALRLADTYYFLIYAFVASLVIGKAWLLLKPSRNVSYLLFAISIVLLVPAVYLSRITQAQGVMYRSNLALTNQKEIYEEGESPAFSLAALESRANFSNDTPVPLEITLHKPDGSVIKSNLQIYPGKFCRTLFWANECSVENYVQGYKFFGTISGIRYTTGIEYQLDQVGEYQITASSDKVSGLSFSARAPQSKPTYFFKDLYVSQIPGYYTDDFFVEGIKYDDGKYNIPERDIEARYSPINSSSSIATSVKIKNIDPKTADQYYTHKELLNVFGSKLIVDLPMLEWVSDNKLISIDNVFSVGQLDFPLFRAYLTKYPALKQTAGAQGATAITETIKTSDAGGYVISVPSSLPGFTEETYFPVGANGEKLAGSGVTIVALSSHDEAVAYFNRISDASRFNYTYQTEYITELGNRVQFVHCPCSNPDINFFRVAWISKNKVVYVGNANDSRDYDDSAKTAVDVYLKKYPSSL